MNIKNNQNSFLVEEAMYTSIFLEIIALISQLCYEPLRFSFHKYNVYNRKLIFYK